ncbi:MAG TPA: division/cell wall cluster transcriptional repressor MraZ [Bellilinea sp.]|nr:division/cell wall cluster transcriptional repressor MraZ [Bellilinea sp.]
MFLGQFEHNVDEKGRVTIPSQYRDELDGSAYVTRGFDQNLWVLPSAKFLQLAESIAVTNMTDSDGRDFRRWIFSSAAKVEVDRAGRILIPQFLRAYGKLQESAMVVGNGTYFEIWDPAMWAKHEEEQMDPAKTSDRFSAISISL